ncbi:MAG: hypothetical protein JKY04_06970, partial [Sneathiella sp.]|nr:hypothetical protein [Sneathiella sp.]
MPKETLNLMTRYLTAVFTETNALTSSEFLEKLLERVAGIANEQPELSDYLLDLQTDLATVFTAEYMTIATVGGMRQLLLNDADEIARRVLRFPAEAEQGAAADPDATAPVPVPSASNPDTYDRENKQEDEQVEDAQAGAAGARFFKAANGRIKAAIMRSLTPAKKKQLELDRNTSQKHPLYITKKSTFFDFQYLFKSIVQSLRQSPSLLESDEDIRQAILRQVHIWLSEANRADTLSKIALNSHFVSKLARFVDAHSMVVRNTKPCISDFERCELVFIADVNASYHGKNLYNIEDQIRAIDFVRCCLEFVSNLRSDEEIEPDWKTIQAANQAAYDKTHPSGVLGEHVQQIIRETQDGMEKNNEDPKLFLAGL